MPRRARVVVPGVPHHVTQRGNNHQRVFFAPENYSSYLKLLAYHAPRCGVRILGYCLMPNHVHLVALPETETSLARALGGTHSEYALALNRTGGTSGHIWQNRFYSCPMSESHVLNALRYIELNAVRAGLAREASQWRWSSARAHLGPNAADPLLCDLAEYFGRWDYEEWKEMLTGAVPEEECDALRRSTSTGEPLGPAAFVADLERRAGRRLRVLGRGRPKKLPQNAEERAAQTTLFGV